MCLGDSSGLLQAGAERMVHVVLRVRRRKRKNIKLSRGGEFLRSSMLVNVFVRECLGFRLYSGRNEGERGYRVVGRSLVDTRVYEQANGSKKRRKK